MCLAVVAVVVMSVWGGGSAMATVEEVAAAAEEADDGQIRWRLCGNFFLVQLFFSLSPPPPLKAKATMLSLAARDIPGALSSLLLFFDVAIVIAAVTVAISIAVDVSATITVAATVISSAAPFS
jgi:hypothetical protein